MIVFTDYRQFVAEDWELVSVTAFMLGATPVIWFRCEPLISYTAVFLLFFIISVCVIRLVMLLAQKWIIGEETICWMRGVISQETDFIELYRIVDYKESQSFLQRLMGIKTVTVYSTDRSDSVIEIKGVPAKEDVVGYIREHVEKCKIDKKIYEITNN